MTHPRRLAQLRPDELDDDQAALYRAILDSPRSQGPRGLPLVDEEGRLNGPFDAMLRSPAVGQALGDLGVALRYRTGLSGRLRELAILTVAAWWDSGFEQAAHEVAGRAAGLTEEELAAVRTGAALALADESERVGLGTTRALLGRRDLDDSEWQAAVDTLGEQAVFELVALVGHYSSLALQLQVFGVPRP